MIKMPVGRQFSVILLLSSFAQCAKAEVVLKTGPDRVKTPLKVDLKRIGTIRPRSTDEIKDSNWVIGCETLDRGYADFDEYKRFLRPLGIKHLRLQGGWAKCEKEKGVYDFKWLDEIVDYALANGIQPTIETSYGNPIYAADGVTGFSGRFPCGKALEGWDNWVRALSKHFKGRVRDWLMWNEPDCDFFQDPLFPSSVAAFNIRTAKIILSEIPGARIGAICSYCYKREPGFEGSDHAFGSTIDCMGKDRDLFAWFVYHCYEQCPEASYPHVEYLQKILLSRGVSPLKLWQGENGCPSQATGCGALGKAYWTEYSQAKWDMRRMLGDLGHDVRSLVFTMCDLQYAKAGGKGTRHNAKGLVRSDGNKKVIAVKRAFYAVQNVVSVFDDTLVRVKDQLFFNDDPLMAAYEYAKTDGRRVYAFWKFANGSRLDPRDRGVPDINKKYPSITEYEKPGDSFETAPRVFRMLGAQPLKEPVWVDLFTGGVYEFPAENMLVTSEGVTYLDVPVYDSPCLLAEKSALDVKSQNRMPCKGKEE